MKIVDAEVGSEKDEGNEYRNHGSERRGSGSQAEAAKKSSIEEDDDEVEATLNLLKKELGL